MKYRLYIDEVGNPGLRAGTLHPNERYLSLTGVIVELEYVDQVMAPEFEKLKRRYFQTHVDEPLVFHRKELVNRRYPFQSLRDPDVERAFNSDLIGVLTNLDYRVITIVIDKQEHLQRYQIWRYHPYHYCQEVLLCAEVDEQPAQGQAQGEQHRWPPVGRSTCPSQLQGHALPSSASARGTELWRQDCRDPVARKVPS